MPDGTLHHQPAFVVKAIDTTGCGDAFHAGYMVGLLLALPLTLRMELGALLASIVATEVGGRQALPFAGELKNHLRDDISDALRQAILENAL
jgi:sugar/nucleoside kinase (ribokinase family)